MSSDIKVGGQPGTAIRQSADEVEAKPVATRLADPTAVPPAPADEFADQAFLVKAAGVLTGSYAPAGTAKGIGSNIVELGANALRDVRTNLGKIPFGDHAALAFRAFSTAYKANDPAIAADPQRGAFEAAHKEPHVWVRSGGLADLGGSISAGAGGVAFGFSGDSSLKYSVLAPYPAEWESAGKLAGNMTINFPLEADAMLASPRGSEFALVGAGSIGASATYSAAGASAGVGPVKAEAFAGIQLGTHVEGEVVVKAKRLDENRVYVELGVREAVAENAFAGFRAKASIERPRLLPGLAGNLVDKQIERIVTNPLEKLLQVQVGATASRSDESKALCSYVLDLSTPEGKAAYERLVRLDIGAAEGLALQGKATRVVFDESILKNAAGHTAQLGPANLFTHDVQRSDEHQRVDALAPDPAHPGEAKASVRERWASAVNLPSTGAIAQLLFGGERKVTWGGVSAQLPTGDPQSIFRLSFQKDDSATRTGEVEEFRRFADGAGVELAGAAPRRDGSFVRSLFNGAYGPSKLEGDVYFTRKGLARGPQRSAEEIEAAFARAAQKVEGTAKPPAWSLPDASDRARALALIEKYGSLESNRTDDRGQREDDKIAWEYREAFGREVRDDAGDLEAAKRLARNLQAMRGKPEAEWVKLFANLGEGARFDFFKHAMALRELCGADETLVAKLSLVSSQGNRLDWRANLDERAKNPPQEPDVRADAKALLADVGTVLGPP